MLLLLLITDVDPLKEEEFNNKYNNRDFDYRRIDLNS